MRGRPGVNPFPSSTTITIDGPAFAELQRMTMQQLLAQARKEGLNDYTGLKKQDLIFKILKERTKMNGLMFGEGTLEVLPDGTFVSTTYGHWTKDEEPYIVSVRFTLAELDRMKK